jgi:hypothetical protein
VLLACGGDDQTVRVWDPASGALLLTVPVHHQVLALDYAAGLLAIAATAGVLAVELTATFSAL